MPVPWCPEEGTRAAGSAGQDWLVGIMRAAPWRISVVQGDSGGVASRPGLHLREHAPWAGYLLPPGIS